MPVLKDFRIKNGLIVGSDNAGTITAGVGNYSTSLSATSLSSVSGNFTGVGGLRVPVGTTAQRPPDTDGFIRLNTSLSQFEGYANSTWTGLGGVIDVNQDTKILPELTPGGNQDTLYFYTGGTERLRITSAGVLSAASDVTLAGDLTVQGNDIKSSGGTAITLSTTDVSIGGDLTVTGNDVKDSGANTVLTFDGSGNVSLPGNLTVTGTHTTLNTSVTSTTTATENNFVITSTDDGASASPDLKLWRNSASPADNDEIGNIFFTGTNSAAAATNYAHILGQITDVTNGTEDGRLTFKTMSAGTLSDRLTINSGSVGIGTTNPNNTLTVAGTLSASGCVDAPLVCGTTSVTSPSVCGTTSVCSPLGCGSTSAESPLVCGTTIVCSPTVHGTTLVCGAAVCGSTSVCSPLVCGSTSAESPLVCGSTSVNTPIVFATSCVDIGGDTKFYRNAANVIRTPDRFIVDGSLSIGTTLSAVAGVTVEGSLSASGIIYADAFNSRTGGSTIDFNDPVDLDGTLTITDDIVHSGDTDTKLSFTTNLISLYGAGSNLLRIDGASNVVGIGTVSTASPSIPTVVEFNNNTTAYKSASATIANGAMASLLKIPIATYRAGKIVLQSVAASGGHMDVTELLYIHNGSDVHTTEYGTIHVTNTAVTTVSAVINSGNVEIRTTNTSGVAAEVVGSITMLSVT